MRTAAISAAVVGLAVLVLSVAVVLSRTPDPDVPRDIALPVASLPADPLRLAILGTSLTALYDWPQDVTELLEVCLDHPVDLTVVARPGAQSPWGVDQLPRVADLDPHIVMIEMAINDADMRDGIWLRQSEAAHRDMITQLNALPSEPRLVLMTMSPAVGLRGLLRFRLGAYYEMNVRVAQEQRVGLLDLYPRWLALPVEARGLEADGLHPAPAIAEPLIMQAIVPYVSASFGKVCDL